MMAFIFPSDPFNKKNPDSEYEQEYLLFKENGFNTYLINIDELGTAKAYPILQDEELIYRAERKTPFFRLEL